MITTEITKLQYDIYGLLAERRLKDAFGKLALLVNELQDWVSRDKLNEMETSYRYMIQYMLDGVEDPERKSIYDHLVLSAYVMGEGKQTVWFPTLAATGHIPHLPPLRFDGLAECKGKA